MKYSIVMALSLIGPPLANARTAQETCPILPPDSGIAWSYREGPDFDLCYALDRKTKDTLFGIYLGHAPSFHPENAKRLSDGRVADRRTIWYAYEKDASEFARQALVALDSEHGFVAHIWVRAHSSADLQRTLTVLENMRFKTNAL